MNRSMRLAAILGLGLVGFSASVSAATFVVNSVLDQQDATPGNGLCASSSGACTLRAAITEANALAGADVITLPAGTYTSTLVSANENNNLGGDFDINSDIAINGAGSASTIIQAATARNVATERVFHLRAAFPMSLTGMTVRYGRYLAAAGTFGAGVRVDTAAVIASLTDVIVEENDNGSSGGGLVISGAVNSVTTLTNSQVRNNTAGGTAATSSTAGGVYLNVATGTLNITDSVIRGNTVSNTSTTVSASGGGISSNGTLSLTNSMVTNNTATSSGFNTFSGGLHIIGGTATIQGSTISGNASTVTAGIGDGFAGGLYNQQATVSLTDSVLTGNTASSFHGGIRILAQNIAASTTITNTTISNNTAVGEGGGVINFSAGAANSTVNITGSTISGNSASGPISVGGGLENVSIAAGLAVINVTNSTISGNSSAGAAGSFNTGANSSINYNYATVAGNTASTDGGGIFQEVTGTTNLKDSIVADNSAATGPDISGTVTSQGYNHIENISGGSFTAIAGDVTGTDPQLAALANNGGTTLTHQPALPSPVVNSIPNGNSECGGAVTTSQNGLARPQAAACEKGSVEVTGTAIFTIGGNVSGLFGSGLVLRNNGGDDLPISSNGAFTFPTPVANGSAYAVTVSTSPTGPNQICILGNRTGTVNASNVTNVSVQCTPNQFSDLSITKTDGVSSVLPGTSTTYTIVATNAGPTATFGAAVNDTFPTACVSVTWSCVAAGGGICLKSGSGNINDIVDLPVGSSVTYTATCAISAAATGTLSNTATVMGTITDPMPGNNSATDVTTLGGSANLGITKTDGRLFVTAGSSTTYAITASNAGPNSAPGSTVTDTFPADCIGVTWTCVGAGGASCAASGSGNINATVNLPSGASVTYTAVCPIAATAVANLVNTATVATGAGVSDPTSGNNSATDSNAVVLFRDGFDGTGVLILDAANSLTFTVPQTAADSKAESLLVANGAYGSSFRLERITSDSTSTIRFVEIAADGTETAGDWMAVAAGETLAIGLIETASHPTIILAGASGEHQFTLAGDSSSYFNVHMDLSRK